MVKYLCNIFTLCIFLCCKNQVKHSKNSDCLTLNWLNRELKMNAHFEIDSFGNKAHYNHIQLFAASADQKSLFRLSFDAPIAAGIYDVLKPENLVDEQGEIWQILPNTKINITDTDSLGMSGFIQFLIKKNQRNSSEQSIIAAFTNVPFE